MKNALSIAGVDPSGGAGVLADIKVFIAHGVYAMGAITAVTAQNTKGIFGMQLVEPKLIEDQIKAIFDDIRVDVIKIGVVPSVEIIKSVAKTLREIKNLPPVVLDPVMSCKNGDIWLEGAAKDAIVEELFPLASVITRELKGESELKEACKELLKFGTKSVYLKCGEIEGKSLDIFYDGSEYEIFSDERIKTTATHGSGCSLSSAIASNLANGHSLKDSVKNAHDYIFNAIKNAVIIGGGQNPVNHFYKFKV